MTNARGHIVVSSASRSGNHAHQADGDYLARGAPTPARTSRPTSVRAIARMLIESIFIRTDEAQLIIPTAERQRLTSIWICEIV